MSNAALAQDSLLPQPTGGLAPGALAALVVHAGLIAALTLSIDWRSRQPEVISAELWAAVPQVASPPSPPPPPPPVVAAPTPAPPVPKPEVQPQVQRDSDIAIERDRRLKLEKQKADDELKRAEAERERKRKAEDKKAEDDRKKREAADAARAAEEKAEDARLDKQRQENLRRIMGQAGTTPNTTGSTGSSTQNAAPSANYLGRLRKMVREQVVFNGNVPGNAAAEVSVTTAPGGTIISSRLLKSSGHKEWDDAVLRALEKLGSLPRDTDGRVPPSLTLVFRQTD